MKLNAKTLAVIAILLALAGLLIMRALIQKPSERAWAQQTPRGTNEPSSQQPKAVKAANSADRTSSVTPDDDVQHYLRATESVREDIKRSEIPLDFYGRVVDENGDGVAGARIRFSYVHFDPLQPFELFRGHGERSLTSDNEGKFSIRGVRGYSFMVEVNKDGYEASLRNFRGASIVGGPDKPVKTDATSPMIFHLRKKGAAEPLVYFERSYRLARDGTLKLIDLLTGRTNSPTADLKVQAWTDEQHKDKEFRYDFRVRIEVMNGGLVESQEEFDYMAPETGYSNSYEINSPASLGDKWLERPVRRFLLQLRDGSIYGRMAFQMIPGGDHFCNIRVWLNPSGSRNLEPDPNLLFPNLDAYNRYMAKQKQVSK
jgi:hypothetical protein